MASTYIPLLAGIALLHSVAVYSAAPVTYNWSATVTSVTGLDFVYPVGTVVTGTFVYDATKAHTEERIAGATDVLTKTMDLWNDQIVSGFVVDGVSRFENFTSVSGIVPYSRKLDLLATDLSVFPGPTFPARLPPLAKFNHRRSHVYTYGLSGWGYEAEVTSLVAADEVGVTLETKILSATRTGTTLQVEFIAASNATVYLQRREGEADWTEVANVAGYIGSFTTTLPTEGFGIFRLRVTTP